MALSTNLTPARHLSSVCATPIYKKMSPLITSSHRAFSAPAVLRMASENYASFWVWNDAPSHGLMYGSTEIRAGGRYGGGILEGNSWSLAPFFPLTATLCFLSSMRFYCVLLYPWCADSQVPGLKEPRTKDRNLWNQEPEQTSPLPVVLWVSYHFCSKATRTSSRGLGN